MLAFGLFSLLMGVSGIAMRTIDIGIASVAGVAVQVLVALSLVPTVGLAGAGWASAAGYLAAAAVLLWRAGTAALSWPTVRIALGAFVGLAVTAYLEANAAGLATRLLAVGTLVVFVAWTLRHRVLSSARLR
jgi:hypothetical protein